MLGQPAFYHLFLSFPSNLGSSTVFTFLSTLLLRLPVRNTYFICLQALHVIYVPSINVSVPECQTPNLSEYLIFPPKCARHLDRITSKNWTLGANIWYNSKCCLVGLHSIPECLRWSPSDTACCNVYPGRQQMMAQGLGFLPPRCPHT